MKDVSMPNCASCETKDCRTGKDCFGVADVHRDIYNDEKIARIHKAAAAIEARHYCKETRLREVILFAKEMDFNRVGLAFCIGLASEAKVIEKILSRDFEVVSVCCKACGINKRTFKLEQISPESDEEIMCNPAGQAGLLNRAGSNLNIICGLCVGHDAIFSMVSKAPVTTLIAKDRVLAHNPIGAVYSQYVRKKMLAENGEIAEEIGMVDFQI